MIPRNKIIIRYKSNQIIMKKDRLFTILIQPFFFYSDFSFLTQYIDESFCIQVYDDFLVRFHLEPKPFETKKSIFFDNLSEDSINFLINLTKS